MPQITKYFHTLQFYKFSSITVSLSLSLSQPLQIPTKHCRVAEGRLQVLQIYRLLQCVREADTEQIKNLVKLGVENLINLCEPKDGTGALHVAVSAKNQGEGIRQI